MKNNSIDFSVPYGKEKLQRIQKELLTILKEVDTLFRKHAIRYSVFYGTLLGTIRHQGFIPWDDDLDIIIFQEDYEKALQLLRQYLPKKYIIHDKITDANYKINWSKITYVNSSVVHKIWHKNNNLQFSGISVDLFRYWEAPCSRFRKMRNLKKERAKLLLLKASSTVSKIKKSKLVLQALPHLIAYTTFLILDKIVKQEMKILTDPEDLISVPHNRETLFPFKEAKFEDVTVFVPNKPDIVLTELYGDFMQIPPKEKQVVHFSSVDFSD